jgi:hypothetical protein
MTLRDGDVYQIKQSSSVVHPAMSDVMYPGGNTEENGSTTERYDCAFQSKKIGSNAHPWVASAPSPASRAQQDDAFPNAASSAASTQDFFSGATLSMVTRPVLFPGSASFGLTSQAPVSGQSGNTVASSGSVAMAGNTQHTQAQPIHFGSLQVPTTMKDASSVFGEIPKQYGFHNLSRQTVFRADGGRVFVSSTD